MSLEIQSLQAYSVREPVSHKTYTLLRVTTKEGLTGWGEAAEISAKDLAEATNFWKNRPATTYAHSPASPISGALDMALLDIVGRAGKAPVYRVLGGPTRNKARAFTSVAGLDALRNATAAGHRAFAVRLPAPASRNQGQAYTNQVRRLAEDIRKQAGDFVVDGAAMLTPGDSARLAADLQSMHPLWFDEPCPVANLEVIRKIADETVIPLGFGRGIAEPGVFQDLLRDSLIGVVRPDIVRFGVTGARRIAALAETYYVAVAPHHDGGPVASAAALQLAASLPNFFIQHLPMPAAAEDRAMRAEIAGNIETVKDGFCALPTGPGLGIAVNEAALEKYRAS